MSEAELGRPHGVDGVHHVGVCVRDLDRSLAFYLDGLGLTLLRRRGPQSAAYLDSLLGLEHVIVSSALLLAGPRQRIELVQYHQPQGVPAEQEVNRPGSMHIAFQLSDIDRACERLRGQGIVFRSEPQTKDSGDMAGMRFAYCRDPDDTLVELTQLPVGAAKHR